MVKTKESSAFGAPPPTVHRRPIAADPKQWRNCSALGKNGGRSSAGNHTRGAYTLMATIAILLIFWVLIGLAIMQLFVPQLVQCIFHRRSYPRGFLQSVALVELIAAVFLVVPETRIWGVSATAGIILAGVVIMIHNRRFIWACAALALLLTLIPVAVAG